MNAQAWRSLLLTLVLAAAAGFIGARLGQGAHANVTPSGTASGVTVRQSVQTLLTRDFDLTAQQKQAIQKIDEDFTRKHNLIWADIRTSNAELAGAVATDMSLSPDAKNAIMEIEASIGRLHTESILYVLEVRKVLTPQQRTHFDEHVVMALMRDPA
jgi:Spy/CpxP family protein refolding chaperone